MFTFTLSFSVCNLGIIIDSSVSFQTRTNDIAKVSYTYVTLPVSIYSSHILQLKHSSCSLPQDSTFEITFSMDFLLPIFNNFRCLPPHPFQLQRLQNPFLSTAPLVPKSLHNMALPTPLTSCNYTVRPAASTRHKSPRFHHPHKALVFGGLEPLLQLPLLKLISTTHQELKLSPRLKAALFELVFS